MTTPVSINPEPSSDKADFLAAELGKTEDHDLVGAPEAATDSAPAGILRRAAAFLVDALIISIIPILISLFLSSEKSGEGISIRLAGAAAALLYFSFFHSSSGGQRSPGKRLLSISVQSLDYGNISFGRALLRNLPIIAFFLHATWPVPTENVQLGLLANVLTLGLGSAMLYLLVVNQGSGQSLPDLLARTRVVSDRKQARQVYPSLPGKHIIGATIAAAVLPAAVLAGFNAEVTQSFPVDNPSTMRFNFTTGAEREPAATSNYHVITSLIHSLQQEHQIMKAEVDFQWQNQFKEGSYLFLVVTLTPLDNLDDSARKKISDKAAYLAQEFVSTADYDLILVRVVRQDEMMWLSRSSTWIYFPPEDYSATVETTNIFHLVTYTREQGIK
jgi:uncharacterized RDD family membrane protein YckC